MALGSLIDAGADLDQVREICGRIPVGGWKLEAEPVLRGGIGATHVIVHTEESGVVRTAGHIAGLIEEARLPDRVRVRTRLRPSTRSGTRRGTPPSPAA